VRGGRAAADPLVRHLSTAAAQKQRNRNCRWRRSRGACVVSRMPGDGHGAVRPAGAGDAAQLFAMARDMATSFVPTWEGFQTSFHGLGASGDVLVLVADGAESALDGYLLGFVHATFYADGPVGWIEELAVRPEVRRHGVGRALVDTFEVWAGSRGARLVAMATRRAAAFYAAIGFEESAVYFRKML
jgi:GNAT superfamily N-acetyltransferase